jgi:hypothetical protein
VYGWTIVDGIYLRKVVGFSPIWGFPRINLLCTPVYCLCCYYCSVDDITVNVKGIKEHW